MRPAPANPSRNPAITIMWNDYKTRRFTERMPSTLSAHVLTYDTEFNEIELTTNLLDVSRAGARFSFRGELEIGQPVQLTFLMPKVMRAFDKTEPEYKIWGVVRWVICVISEDHNQVQHEVGVAFTGKFAPDGFLANPSKRYDIRPTPTQDKLWIVREMRQRYVY